jgi:hypothetical protein
VPPSLPPAKLKGHGEVVRGLASIATQSAYMTASWDKTLRLWRWPVQCSAAGGGPVASDPRKSLPQQDSSPNELYLSGEAAEEGEQYESEWIKAHPVKVPTVLNPVSAAGMAQGA